MGQTRAAREMLKPRETRQILKTRKTRTAREMPQTRERRRTRGMGIAAERDGGKPMKKREMEIMELLTEHGRMDVSEIAGRLGVSHVTIRKDLADLEKRFLLRREHGCAVLGHGDDMNNRLAYHYEQKRLIARSAVELVRAGETIMIENGSCCALFAEALTKARKNVTIITNSAFIAGYIRHIEGARVVLIGGDFQNDAQVMVGPIVRVCASQFYVDKLFIGVDGYSSENGFSGDNHLRVQAVRDMADFAEKVYVITESEKFSKRSVVSLNLKKPVRGVITDGAISPERRKELAGKGVDLIIADKLP